MDTIRTYFEERKKDLHIQLLEYRYLKNCIPNIVIIQIGSNELIENYIRCKIADCKEIGINYTLLKYKETTNEKKILKKIYSLNKNENIHGIIVQYPIPEKFNNNLFKSAIIPEKDIGADNILSNFNLFMPTGILNFIKTQNIDLENKNIFLLGKNTKNENELSKLFLKEKSNVICATSKISKDNIEHFVSISDIIVSSSGKKNILNKKYKYKPTAIIFDAGYNKNDEGRLIGDCEKNLNVKYQSPVPNGVSLLSRLTFIENIILAFKNNQ